MQAQAKENPCMEVGMWTWNLPLTKEWLASHSCRGEGESIFSNNGIPGRLTACQSRPPPETSWATRTGLDGGGGENSKFGWKGKGVWLREELGRGWVCSKYIVWNSQEVNFWVGEGMSMFENTLYEILKKWALIFIFLFLKRMVYFHPDGN